MYSARAFSIQERARDSIVISAKSQSLGVCHLMAPVAAAFSDLREIVRYVEDKALSWIIDRRQSFNPLSHLNIQQIKLAIKASAELALVCALAEDNNALSHLSRYRQPGDFVWNAVFQLQAPRWDALG